MVTKIPSSERKLIRSELVAIADRLVKRCNLTIPESRRAIHEILDVSV